MIDIFPQTRKMPLICLVEQGKAKKWYLTFIKSTRAMWRQYVYCPNEASCQCETGYG